MNFFTCFIFTRTNDEQTKNSQMPEETIQYKFSDEEITEAIVTETYEYHESPIPRPNTFAQSCWECKDILRRLLKPKNNKYMDFELGPRIFTADTKPACVICMLAWSWHRTWCRAQGLPIPRIFELNISSNSGILEVRVTNHSFIRAPFERRGRLASCQRRNCEPLEFQRSQADQLPHRVPQGTSVALLLDIARISSWLAIPDSAGSVAPEQSGCAALFCKGLRLIDCERKSLVKKLVPCKYLALSYVWGTPCCDWLTLRIWNEELLMEPGVLGRDDIVGQRLPNIIKDAMQLTLELGFTYIWADALCIIQDNASDRDYLIDAMDHIYRAAAATVIVPGSRGADDSIPGLLCRRDQVPQWRMTVATNASEIYIQSLPFERWHYIDLSPRNARAWILQEQILSKRLLCLTEHEAFFCTGEYLFREGSSVRLNVTDSEFQMLSNVMMIVDYAPQRAAHEPLLYMKSLVKDYTRRDMTDPADILRAFTGVYNALCRHRSDYIPIERTQGIIPHFLPESLLWRSILDHEPNTSSPLHLSTWTWAHWQGLAVIASSISPSSKAITQDFHFGPCQTTPPSISPQALNDLMASDSVLRPVIEDYELSYNLVPTDLFPSRELRRGELSFWAPTLLWSEDLTLRDSGTELLLAGEYIGYVDFDSGRQTTPNHLVFLMYENVRRNSYFHGLAVTDVDGVSSRVGYFRSRLPEKMARLLKFQQIVLR